MHTTTSTARQTGNTDEQNSATMCFVIRRVTTCLLVAILALVVCAPAAAQQLIYQEGFNDDGELAGRYVTTGRGRNGDNWWAHNFDLVNILPGATAPARRAGMFFRPQAPNVWNPTTDQLLTNATNWARSTPSTFLYVVNGALSEPGDFRYRDLLQGLGHTVTVIDDLATPNFAGIDAVVISSDVQSGDVGFKYTTVPLPVINFASALHDELGIASSGGTVSDNTINILNAAHPLASGVAAGLQVVTTGQNVDLNHTGGTVAPGATIVARVRGISTPTVNDFAQMDQLIAGTGAYTTRTIAGPAPLAMADVHGNSGGNGHFGVDNAHGLGGGNIEGSYPDSG